MPRMMISDHQIPRNVSGFQLKTPLVAEKAPFGVRGD